MTVTDTIVSARVEVVLGSGHRYVIELESIEHLPIEGTISVDVEAVEDLPASWEAGYKIRRPGSGGQADGIHHRGRVRRQR